MSKFEKVHRELLELIPKLIRSWENLNHRLNVAKLYSLQLDGAELELIFNIFLQTMRDWNRFGQLKIVFDQLQDSPAELKFLDPAPVEQIVLQKLQARDEISDSKYINKFVLSMDSGIPIWNKTPKPMSQAEYLQRSEPLTRVISETSETSNPMSINQIKDRQIASQKLLELWKETEFVSIEEVQSSFNIRIPRDQVVDFPPRLTLGVDGLSRSDVALPLSPDEVQHAISSNDNIRKYCSDKLNEIMNLAHKNMGELYESLRPFRNEPQELSEARLEYEFLKSVGIKF